MAEKRKGDKTYVLFWHGGMKPDILYGRDIAEACNNAGIGAGAMRAMDYYSEVPKGVTPEQHIIDRTNHLEQIKRGEG